MKSTNGTFGAGISASRADVLTVHGFSGTASSATLENKALPSAAKDHGAGNGMRQGEPTMERSDAYLPSSRSVRESPNHKPVRIWWLRFWLLVGVPTTCATNCVGTRFFQVTEISVQRQANEPSFWKRRKNSA